MQTPESHNSRHFHDLMSQACDLAEAALGQVWPNPAVGCVIFDPNKNQVIAWGATQKGGRPHAETVALSMAGNQAQNCWAFVSLEPCCHHGQTPPCTDALIQAGIKRVYVATSDPDPRVAGQGIIALKNAGIGVDVGLQEFRAKSINQGFFLKVGEKRPLITVKVATSMDGRIALKNGQSQWLTGPQARNHLHHLRLQQDAIMVGMNTVIMDNPRLTSRLPAASHQPVRIVISQKTKLPLASNLIQTLEEAPLWWICSDQLSQEELQPYRDLGVQLLPFASEETGSFNLKIMLSTLAEQGITRLMVEGGQKLVTSFMHHYLIDHLIWYRSPHLIGGDGLAVFDALGYTNLDQALNFTRTNTHPIGTDHVDFWERTL